ncbi:MAG: ATP synthase F1 subunit delta [Planctomycetota bacterium]
MSLLARRYATALFEVAQSRGATAAVLADLEKLHAAFGDDAGRAFLADPNTKRAQVESLVDRALAGSNELTRSALGVVLDRRREALLPDLASALRAMVQEQAGEAVAVVETAKPLSEADQSALREQMARRTGKRIVLDVRDNPDLLGGVRVRVGNTLYDGSLLGELEALQQALLQAPVTGT